MKQVFWILLAASSVNAGKCAPLLRTSVCVSIRDSYMAAACNCAWRNAPAIAHAVAGTQHFQVPVTTKKQRWPRRAWIRTKSLQTFWTGQLSAHGCWRSPLVCRAASVAALSSPSTPRGKGLNAHRTKSPSVQGAPCTPLSSFLPSQSFLACPICCKSASLC
jgi:hypothetical protein